MRGLETLVINCLILSYASSDYGMLFTSSSYIMNYDTSNGNTLSKIQIITARRRLKHWRHIADRWAVSRCLMTPICNDPRGKFNCCSLLFPLKQRREMVKGAEDSAKRLSLEPPAYESVHLLEDPMTMEDDLTTNEESLASEYDDGPLIIWQPKY